MLVMNKGGLVYDYWITRREQKIYSSVQFYRIVNELERIGFVRSKTTKVSNFVKKEYALTLYGKLLCEKMELLKND